MNWKQVWIAGPAGGFKVGFYSEVQRFEAWQYNFTVINRKATEDGIQAFDKGAAIYDRDVAPDTDELKGDRWSNRGQYGYGEP